MNPQLPKKTPRKTSADEEASPVVQGNRFRLFSLHHNTHSSWSVVLVHQEQLSDHFHFIFGSGGGGGRGLLEPVPAVPGQR